MTRPLILLASTSPRRQELLKILDLSFTVVPPLIPLTNEGSRGSPSYSEIDETPLPGEVPADLVQRLSRIKAEAVVARLPALPFNREENKVVVIAADTVVVLADKILGKPGQPAEAVYMLTQLRQQCHHVYSGLTVAATTIPPLPSVAQTEFVTRLHCSQVWMRPYTDAEIAAYVASGDPLDKAGAYGIQNKSFAPVERLNGCFASVMGLPLGELAAVLQEIGVSVAEVGPRCAQYTGHPCCQQSPAPL